MQILNVNMRKSLIVLGSSLSLLLISCGGNDKKEEGKDEPVDAGSLYAADFEKGLLTKAQNFFQPLPDVVESDNNPVTAEKVKLGRVLYMDTRLSKDGNISCNSCHKLDQFGVDNLPTSPGDLGNNGDRNSPSVYNAAVHTTQFWDGRAADVEEQAGMPILNPVEMNIPNQGFLIERLSEVEEYQKLFAEAFPGESKPINFNNLEKAIGAFERTLTTPSHFDDFVKGDFDALSDEEKKGLNEFIEVGCITCHTGPAIGGNMFQKFGVYGRYWEITGSEKIDEGRFAETGNESEKYMFKVPSLRNVEKTGPYLHDGSIDDLDEVIRIMARIQLDKELTEDQVAKIRVFLRSLTGKSTAGVS